MDRTEIDEGSFWNNFGSVGAAVIGVALIVICLALSFWFAFVVLLIPVILIAMIGGFVVSRRDTPDTGTEQGLTGVGYRGRAAEYEVQTESSTGTPPGRFGPRSGG